MTASLSPSANSAVNDQHESSEERTAGLSAADTRLDWITRHVKSLLSVEDAAFTKLMTDEKHRTMVESFLNVEDMLRLMFYQQGKDLVVVSDPPEHLQHRTAYFVKRKAQVLTPETIDGEVMTGDVTDPLPQLLLLSKGIVLPLLLNPANPHSMPKAMLAEATTELHRFIANAEVEVGKRCGETILPLPLLEAEKSNVLLPPLSSRQTGPGSPLHTGAILPGVRQTSLNMPATGAQRQQFNASRAPGSLQYRTQKPAGPYVSPPSRFNDRDHTEVELLESAVATWQQQVEGVLRSDPDAALKMKGKHPGPNVELKFWTDRSRDLTSISAQLVAEESNRVRKVLEAARSSYLPIVCRLIKDVEEARAAAAHTVACLQPLVGHLNRLSPDSATDFVSLPETYGPFCRILLLIWRHAIHWAVPSRLAALMRETANDLLASAAVFLPGTEVIQMEPTEALSRINTTRKVVRAFRESYLEARRKSAVMTPARPWRTSTRLIFCRLDAYLTRLDEAYRTFSTASSYSRLEKVEIGGTQGHLLTTAIRKLFLDFTVAWTGMLKIEYDVLSLDSRPSELWSIDCSTFLHITYDLDKRLGHIVSQVQVDISKAIHLTISCRLSYLESHLTYGGYSGTWELQDNNAGICCARQF